MKTNSEKHGTSTHRDKDRQIVLVLQGGGALGAYQAGVYHALHEHGIEPDWIVGTSIGAINASLIAGNARANRLERLKEFWTRMAYRPPLGAPAWSGLPDLISYWKTILRGIPDFFQPNPGAFLGTHVPLGADAAGFYSTAPLEKTLLELVDFSLVNKCSPRLTVGAAHVRTSEMRYFDSRDGEIGVKHIMASGALPPAFPAVRIDGELYWDGGILSNTPTEVIFDDDPRRNSLIFAVHLWNPDGRRATHHLGGSQPTKGHSVLEPSREPHRAAAANAQHAPCHSRPRQTTPRGYPHDREGASAGCVRLPHDHARRAPSRAET